MLSSTRAAAFFWTLVVFVVQNGLVWVFPDRVPQLLLLNVIFYGFIEGASFGFVLGIFAGMLLEIFGTGRMGMSVFLAGGVGLFSGLLSSKIFPESFLTKALFPSFVGFLFALCQIMATAQATGAELPQFSDWVVEAWNVSHPIFTAILSPFFFQFLEKFSFIRQTRRVYWV